MRRTTEREALDAPHMSFDTEKPGTSQGLEQQLSALHVRKSSRLIEAARALNASRTPVMSGSR